MTSDETTRSTTVGLIEEIDSEMAFCAALPDNELSLAGVLVRKCRAELAKQAEYIAGLQQTIRSMQTHYSVEACHRQLDELAKQAERCSECNCELSHCGEQNDDGEPKLDCPLCQLRIELAQVRRARDTHWENLTKQAEEIQALNETASQFHRESVKQAERVAALEGAIDASGWDISPCFDCGTPVVTIPDDAAICKKCMAVLREGEG